MVTTAAELLARYANGERNFTNIDLSGEKFHVANLSDIILINAILWQTDFRNSNLMNAKFGGDNTTLRDTNFEDTNLFGAVFKGVNIFSTKLRGARFRGDELDDEQTRYAKNQGAIGL